MGFSPFTFGCFRFWVYGATSWERLRLRILKRDPGMVGGLPPPNTPWDPKTSKKITVPNFKTRFDPWLQTLDPWRSYVSLDPSMHFFFENNIQGCFFLQLRIIQKSENLGHMGLYGTPMRPLVVYIGYPLLVLNAFCNTFKGATKNPLRVVNCVILIDPWLLKMGTLGWCWMAYVRHPRVLPKMH